MSFLDKLKAMFGGSQSATTQATTALDEPAAETNDHDHDHAGHDHEGHDHSHEAMASEPADTTQD